MGLGKAYDGIADEALIAIALRGGREARAAFGELIERHETWLLRYLYYLLDDMGRADDVAQDVFVRVHRDLGKLRERAAFRAWLRKIATRLAFNHRRSASNRTRYEDQAQTPTSTTDHEVQLVAQDAVHKTLARLPHPYREILVLRYLEELTVHEIAELLNLGISAAKMRLSRARDDFRVIHGALDE